MPPTAQDRHGASARPVAAIPLRWSSRRPAASAPGLPRDYRAAPACQRDRMTRMTALLDPLSGARRDVVPGPRVRVRPCTLRE